MRLIDIFIDITNLYYYINPEDTPPMTKKEQQKQNNKKASENTTKGKINKHSQVLIKKLKKKNQQKSIEDYFDKNQLKNSYSHQDKDTHQKFDQSKVCLEQSKIQQQQKYQYFFDFEEPCFEIYEEREESLISGKQFKPLTEQQLKNQRQRQALLKKKRLKALLYCPERQQFELSVLNIYEPLLAEYTSMEGIDQQPDDSKILQLITELYTKQKQNRLAVQQYLIFSDYLTKRNFSGHWQNLQIKESQYFLSKKEKLTQYKQMFRSIKEKNLDLEGKNQPRIKELTKNLLILDALFKMKQQANLIVKKNKEINQIKLVEKNKQLNNEDEQNNSRTEESYSGQIKQIKLPQMALRSILDLSIIQRISAQIDQEEKQQKQKQDFVLPIAKEQNQISMKQNNRQKEGINDWSNKTIPRIEHLHK